MEHISKSLPVARTSQWLTQQSQNSNAGRLKAARECYIAVMKGRPEYGHEDPVYTAGFIENLSHYTDQELAWLADPREGLGARCKYLPTPADVYDLVRERRVAMEKINPPTSWKRLEPEHGPWEAETDYSRKKSVVSELLGYNPETRHGAPRRDLAGIPEDALKDRIAASKYANAGISPELRAKLDADEWPNIPMSGA